METFFVLEFSFTVSRFSVSRERESRRLMSSSPSWEKFLEFTEL